MIGQKPMFYQSIKHRKSVVYCVPGHLRTLKKCRKNRLWLVFSTFPSCSRMPVVFYQCHTRLRLLYLLNIPLVKFIKITSRTHNLTREFIDYLISVYFPVKHSCLHNKKKITRRLKDMNFVFSCQKQYFNDSLRSFVKCCFATRK